MEVLRETSGNVYTHSLASAVYSVLIAKELNFESSVTSFKLCLAGIFHDIGKKEIDRKLLEKSRDMMNVEERKLIESHVVRSQEILNSIKFIHSDVIRIVQEHHEDLDGKGYPVGKKKFEQHPLSRILQCANIFIENVSRHKVEKGHVNVGEVLSEIETVYGARVDDESLGALRSLFKLAEADI